jgi:hypothetical protein
MNPLGMTDRQPERVGSGARTTLAFAALHDHARLPARFFGRILAAGGVRRAAA